MASHDLSCYFRMAVAQARSQMQYRFDFFTQVISAVLSYGGQFVALWWLAERFQHIDGWRIEELLVLYAMMILAWGVCVGTFVHLESFEDFVRDGTFDRALLRPINPLIHVLGSRSPISGLGQFLFAISVFVFAIMRAGVTLTPAKLVYLVLTALGGGMIFGAAMIMVAAIAFWTTRSYDLFWNIVFPARQLVQYPVSIYSRWLQAILMVVVPFAFINYFPAHVILDRVQSLDFPLLAWATPPVGLLALTVAYQFWRWGTRFYTGTGS